MGKFELVRKSDSGMTDRFPITEKELLVGRDQGSDIMIPDRSVSRRHARVWLEAGRPWIKDLNSRNGVRLNGKKIGREELKAGDQVEFGRVSFIVELNAGTTVSQAVIGLEKSIGLQTDIMREADGTRLLVLYRAARLLETVFDLEELLQEILKLVFDALPVSRGFILLENSLNRELEIMASLSLRPEMEAPPFSRTMIRQVFDKAEAVLTVDAQEDKRFDIAESIMRHNIHSAMCAPLCGKTAVIGALYVDSGNDNTGFSDSELEMLSAMARIVGVAVENARLYREQLQREKLVAIGQATAGIGHCIKNILTGLHGGCELINLSFSGQDKKYLEKGLHILDRSIVRIDQLVMNMMAFSKDRRPDRRETDINQIAREVLESLKAEAERNNVILEMESSMERTIQVDALDIYRVLLNLVKNAIDACAVKKGGKVRIQCSLDQEACRLNVSDTGCGMTPETEAGLFQAFSSSKGSAGTGLGLACSLKIVQEHHGRIEVETAPDRGSVFSVFIPAEN